MDVVNERLAVLIVLSVFMAPIRVYAYHRGHNGGTEGHAE